MKLEKIEKTVLNKCNCCRKQKFLNREMQINNLKLDIKFEAMNHFPEL
jgi:hypothetical protein